jgi:hypothetical protein
MAKIKQKAAKAAAAAASEAPYVKQQVVQLSAASEAKIRSLLQVWTCGAISIPCGVSSLPYGISTPNVAVAVWLLPVDVTVELTALAAAPNCIL